VFIIAIFMEIEMKKLMMIHLQIIIMQAVLILIRTKNSSSHNPCSISKISTAPHVTWSNHLELNIAGNVIDV
jgi:hypothetical protein